MSKPDEQILWKCFWCSGEASLTKDGEMHYELYDKIICDNCWKKHWRYKIIYGSGLRKDGRQPAFQLEMSL